MCKKCISILFDREDKVNDTWEKQMNNWSLVPDKDVEYYYFYNDKYDEVVFEDELKKTRKCICGVDIVENFPIYNTSLKFCCVLGSTCILSFEDNKGIFNNCEKIKEQYKIINSYYCKVCDVTIKKDYLDKHNNTKKHKENIISGGKKKCKRCNQYKIKKNTTYKYCYDCYKKFANLVLSEFNVY